MNNKRAEPISPEAAATSSTACTTVEGGNGKANPPHAEASVTNGVVATTEKKRRQPPKQRLTQEQRELDRAKRDKGKAKLDSREIEKAIADESQREKGEADAAAELQAEEARAKRERELGSYLQRVRDLGSGFGDVWFVGDMRGTDPLATCARSRAGLVEVPLWPHAVCHATYVSAAAVGDHIGQILLPQISGVVRPPTGDYSEWVFQVEHWRQDVLNHRVADSYYVEEVRVPVEQWCLARLKQQAGTSYSETVRGLKSWYPHNLVHKTNHYHNSSGSELQIELMAALLFISKQEMLGGADSLLGTILAFGGRGLSLVPGVGPKAEGTYLLGYRATTDTLADRALGGAIAVGAGAKVKFDQMMQINPSQAYDGAVKWARTNMAMARQAPFSIKDLKICFPARTPWEFLMGYVKRIKPKTLPATPEGLRNERDITVALMEFVQSKVDTAKIGMNMDPEEVYQGHVKSDWKDGDKDRKSVV